jgi:hypothetical protein
MEYGVLKHVLAVLAFEAAAAARGGGSASTLRLYAWVLHNLAKHKREKDMASGCVWPSLYRRSACLWLLPGS